LGSLIATDMTRCIQCTRCVRFGEEISGERELGATGRSEHVEIGTFIQQNVNSEVSGNIIDLCPVGALTSKPFRFRARAWELKQYPGVSPHDCIGSNLYLHVTNNTVMRVVPKHAEEYNEVWLSDRDRFSYEALLHDQRLRKPMMFKNDKWNIVSWVDALKYAIAGIKLCVDNYGAEQLGVLASPNATVEEFYLLQKLARDFGTNNIDHRLRQLDFRAQEFAPQYPNLGLKFKDLETQDAVLLVGSQLHKEQPIAGLKLRKVVLNGGAVCVINPADFKFNFNVTAKAIISPADMVLAMAGVAKELLTLKPHNKPLPGVELLNKITPTANDKQIAAKLSAAKQPHIILGQLALMLPQASELIYLANLISKLIDGTFGYFSDGANAAGAWLTGCLPHRMLGGNKLPIPGKNALEMLQHTSLKCYILFAIEPELDSIWGEQALQTLKQADFVVVFSSYQSPALLEIADIILPIATFAETAGTLINVDGKWQSFAEVVPTFADSRPGWKILRVLGSLAGFSNFEFESATELLDAIKQQVGQTLQTPTWQLQAPSELSITKTKGLLRVAPVALYSTDSIVRRSAALQQTKDATTKPSLQINTKTASSLNIKDGAIVKASSELGSIIINAEIDDRIADQTVIINQANDHTIALGAHHAIVEVSLC